MAKLRAETTNKKQLGHSRIVPAAEAMTAAPKEHLKMQLSCRTGCQHLSMNFWLAPQQGACQHLPKIQVLVR